MKRTLKRSHCAGLAVLLALTGCGPSQQKDTGTTGVSTNAPAEPRSEMAKPAETLALPANNFVAVQKQEFIAAAQSSLKRVDSGISNLVQKSEAYMGATRTNADQALADLGAQRKQAAAQLEEVKGAVSEDWSAAKSGFAAAMADLRNKYESAKAKFQQYDMEKLQSSTGTLSATNQN